MPEERLLKNKRNKSMLEILIKNYIRDFFLLDR